MNYRGTRELVERFKILMEQDESELNREEKRELKSIIHELDRRAIRRRVHKPRIYTQYCERGFTGELYGFGKAPKHVCRECNFTAKRYTSNCPSCHAGESMVNVGELARPPRKNASKKKWSEFWNHWAKVGHNCR